jgi:hypothetical protein
MKSKKTETDYQCIIDTPPTTLLHSRIVTLEFELLEFENFSLAPDGTVVPGDFKITFPGRLLKVSSRPTTETDHNL